jgi:hypothetical protein
LPEWQHRQRRLRRQHRQFHLLAVVHVGPVRVTAAEPTSLFVTSGFVQKPPSGTAFVAGEALNDIVVEVRVFLGNVVRDDNTTVVSLAILQTGTHPFATMLRDNGQNLLYVQRTVHNGVATFSGVKAIVQGAGYQLNVSTDSIPVKPQSQDSTFDVVAGKVAGWRCGPSRRTPSTAAACSATPTWRSRRC